MATLLPMSPRGVPQIREATLESPNKGKAASATAKALEDLNKLKATLAFAEKATFDDCIREACSRFYGLFRDRVLQLAHNFPEVLYVILNFFTRRRLRRGVGPCWTAVE